MTDGFLGISWFVWAALAAALAAMFTVIQIPKQTSQTTGFTHIVLRWFHSVTWDFLALSFLAGLHPNCRPWLTSSVWRASGPTSPGDRQ